MKKIIILIFLILPLPGLSEEYICSGLSGKKIETKIYERRSDHFFQSTSNWKFIVLYENYKHIMLGNIEFYDSHQMSTLFLTIIDKETKEFSERFVQSNDKHTYTLFGKCIVKNLK